MMIVLPRVLDERAGVVGRGRDGEQGLGAPVNKHQQCRKQPSQGAHLLLGGLGGDLGWGNFIFG